MYFCDTKLHHMAKRVSQKGIIFEPVFNRKKILNKSGEAVIEIRAYKDRARVFVSTKIFVRPSQWDEKNKLIKSNHPQADVLNVQINEMLHTYEKMQSDKIISDTPFSLDEFRNASTIDVSNQSFLSFMEEQIKKNTNNNKEKTKRSHTNALNHIKQYRSGKDVLFSDINYGFVEGFLNYLRDESKSQNTIHKQWKIFKHYIEKAIDNDKIKISNPCRKFKISEEKVDRLVLSLPEMIKLQNLDLSEYNEKLRIVRDMFLFACYTGLRISDVISLENSCAIKSKSGWDLRFKSKKVDKPVNLPLHLLFARKKKQKSRAVEIFEKYYNKNNQYVFPIRQEQIVNAELKGIAAILKIDFNLHFHIGRHTFGTYMATKVPLPILRELMQHSDIRTTMRYVHINEEMVNKGLLEVNWEC